MGSTVVLCHISRRLLRVAAKKKKNYMQVQRLDINAEKKKLSGQVLKATLPETRLPLVANFFFPQRTTVCYSSRNRNQAVCFI